MNNVSVDEEGEVQVDNEIVIGKTLGLFGEKVYEGTFHQYGSG